MLPVDLNGDGQIDLIMKHGGYEEGTHRPQPHLSQRRPNALYRRYQGVRPR